MSDLRAKEIAHLFGTTDSDDLKRHTALVFAECGRGGQGLSTYSHRTPTKLACINECNLNPAMTQKLAEFRMEQSA